MGRKIKNFDFILENEGLSFEESAKRADALKEAAKKLPPNYSIVVSSNGTMLSILHDTKDDKQQILDAIDAFKQFLNEKGYNYGN